MSFCVKILRKKFSCENCHTKTYVSNLMHFQGEIVQGERHGEAKVLNLFINDISLWHTIRLVVGKRNFIFSTILKRFFIL